MLSPDTAIQNTPHISSVNRNPNLGASITPPNALTEMSLTALWLWM